MSSRNSVTVQHARTSNPETRAGIPLHQYRRHCRELTILVLTFAVYSTMLNFSHVQDFQSADPIVEALISLHKWTPFFWGQDRFGMLVPLIAVPVHNPFANLLLQGWLMTFCALSAGFLVLRYLSGDWPLALVGGAIINLAELGLLTGQAQFDWFMNQPYGISLALAPTALIALEKPGARRWVLAVLLMLLAGWVNLGIFPLLAPLVVLHYRIFRQRGYLLRSLSCLCLGALIGWALMRTSPFHVTKMNLAPVREWPHAWLELMRNTYGFFTPNLPRLLWLILPLVGMGCLLAIRRGHAKRNFQLAWALTGTALLYSLVMGTLVWTRMNLYSARYVYPALLLIFASLAVFPASALVLFGHKRSFGVLSLMIVGVVLYRFGAPSPAYVRRKLDYKFGQMTEEVLTTHAAAIAGDYFTVWPAVFSADLALYERGDPERVYGLTFRSPMVAQLRAAPRLCIAAPPDASDILTYLAGLGIHPTRTQHYKTMTLLVVNQELGCERLKVGRQ